MKSLKALLFSSIVLLVFACKDDDSTDVKPTLLRFNFDAAYSTSTSDDWVILYDQNGNVIDFRSIESGESISLDKPSTLTGDKFSLSVFRVETRNEISYYNIHTWLEVPTGIELTSFDPYQALVTTTKPGKIGSYNVSIENTPGFLTAHLSSKWGSMDYNTVAYNELFQFTEVSIRRDEPNHFLAVQSGSTGPRYKWIENPKNNDKLVVDFDELLKFDKELNVTLPTSSLIGAVVGFDGSGTSDNSYQIFGHSGMFTGSTTLGFLNRFQNYSFYFLGTSLAYSYFGPAPTSVPNFNASNFVVTDESIVDFRLTSSEPYFERRTFYGSFDGPVGSKVSVGVTYIAPSGDFTHPPILPAELLAKYPAVDPNKLTYRSTGIIFKRSDYLHTIEGILGKDYTFTPHEIALITIE